MERTTEVSCYNMIADEKELEWFFNHVIMKPKVNESYSAVFVSRHKKLTEEEAKEFGVTRREAEFLSTQTFRLKTVKDASKIDSPDNWNFSRFLQNLTRFNVDKRSYLTGGGKPIPEKTLAVLFYVNPCDDMKVCKKFIDEYMLVTEGITKAMIGDKTVEDNYQSFQWFGKVDSTLKHLRANSKGSKYWMDFDIDVPEWFRNQHGDGDGTGAYFAQFKFDLDRTFGKGNYVIISTCGGYHVLVRTKAIKSNPEDFCELVKRNYEHGVEYGYPAYVDEKGTCKFECIVNDSQIPGLPLPGTYQYNRPVTVLNKEDFE